MLKLIIINKQISSLVLLLGVASILLLRGIGDSSLGYPDADRILMDGVFIHDFLKDLPLTHIYDYTINYYGQYPALSIGYRPPFFPLIEAIFNTIFGVNMWSSRLALLSFALLGITLWYKLLLRIFNHEVAFFSTLLFITSPFIAKWGWYTMAELPVLAMVIATGYFFYLYIDTKKASYLYITALLFGLSAWTKQTAIFMGIWFIIHLLIRRELFKTLKRKEVLYSIAIILVILVPLAIITLWLGKMNLYQSVGTGAAADPLHRLSLDNLGRQIENLYRYHLTRPVLLISMIGIIFAVYRKDRRTLYFASMIIGTYIFFTYLLGKNERYPIFWIPAFTLFAAVPLSYLKPTRMYKYGYSIVLITVAANNMWSIYNRPVNYATGYDQAAQYVLSHSTSPITFFDGYNDGYFTYFIRALDPNRTMYVLRGDKLLTSSAIDYKHWLTVHAHSRNDINDILDKYGIEYITIEKRDVSDLEIHRILRKYLAQGPFKLVKEIPVSSSRPVLEGQSLLIYRYINNKKPSAPYVEIDLPVVGKRIRVPLRTMTTRNGK